MVLINKGPAYKHNGLQVTDIFHIPTSWIENVDYSFTVYKNNFWDLKIYTSVNDIVTQISPNAPIWSIRTDSAFYPLQNLSLTAFLVSAGNSSEKYLNENSLPNGGDGGACLYSFFKVKKAHKVKQTYDDYYSFNINIGENEENKNTKIEIYRIYQKRTDTNYTTTLLQTITTEDIPGAKGGKGYKDLIQEPAAPQNGTKYETYDGKVFYYGSGGGIQESSHHPPQYIFGGLDSGGTGRQSGIPAQEGKPHTGGGGGAGSYSPAKGGSGVVILSNYNLWNNFYSFTGDSEIFWDSQKNWCIKLLSSGYFSLKTDSESNVDIHTVGGGGGGGNCGGGGGGGGYVNTVYNQILNTKHKYYVQVGSGGQGAQYNETTPGKNGEPSYFGNICYAKGGFGGGSNNTDSSLCKYGGNGGSGGGSGVIAKKSNGGGSNSSDGGSNGQYKGGKGQTNIANTYDFQDENLTLRAGGGGGGSEANYTSPNTAIYDWDRSLYNYYIIDDEYKQIKDSINILSITKSKNIAGEKGLGGGGYGGYGTKNSADPAICGTSGLDSYGGGGGGSGKYSGTRTPDITRFSGNGGKGIVLIRKCKKEQF